MRGFDERAFVQGSVSLRRACFTRRCCSSSMTRVCFGSSALPGHLWQQIPLPAPQGREKQRLPHLLVWFSATTVERKAGVLTPSASPPRPELRRAASPSNSHPRSSDEAHRPGRLPSYQGLNIKRCDTSNNATFHWVLRITARACHVPHTRWERRNVVHSAFLQPQNQRLPWAGLWSDQERATCPPAPLAPCPHVAHTSMQFY